MKSVVLQAPLDSLSLEARPYPADMLEDCQTGLLLFAAAFLGVNDAIHYARKQMVCTCVDTNPERLGRMEALYPSEWSFVAQDAWEFARAAAERGKTWDALSVDTFTGTATNRSLQSLDLWCSLATRCLTVTIGKGQSFVVPDGWRGSVFPREGRSEIASWLVMRR